jgi:hypothetical protein
MRASIMPDDRPCCHKNVANRGFRNIEMTPPFLDTFRLLLSRQTVGSIRGKYGGNVFGRLVAEARNAGKVGAGYCVHVRAARNRSPRARSRILR